MVQTGSQIGQAVTYKRGECEGWVGRRVDDDTAFDPTAYAERGLRLVLTDKAIGLHLQKPFDCQPDYFEVFVRSTKLSPMGHCEFRQRCLMCERNYRLTSNYRYKS